MTQIILASSSPRRKELLSQIGLTFDVIPSDCEEKIEGETPEEIVIGLSLQKAADVADKLADPSSDSLIIGADTIVVSDGQILGKPKSEDDAFRMLTKLQGRTHSVYTGVTLIHLIQGKEWIKPFCEKTEVHVSPMGAGEIRDYIKTKDPLDKAGAYGIQGPFAKFVSGISGDYYNVVGLPLAALYKELKQIL